MIQNIIHSGNQLAIIIKSDFHSKGIEFFTPDNFSQQLGYMNRPQGYVIPPHRHNLVSREVVLTQEVLYIKSGKVRVDFYNDDQVYLESRVVEGGDVIFLAAGGHGFEMLESSEIIEIKQGPYCGERDKIRFDHISSDQVVLK